MTQKVSRVNQLQSDATEFGNYVRCGGWRLGLLVARNVEHGGKGGRPATKNPSLVMGSAKVSMTKFSELAGVSQSQVSYYFNAWELAAAAGLVPRAEQITFGDDEVGIDIDSIEVEDDPKTEWGHFYRLAKNPPSDAKKPEKKQDSKAKQLPVDDDEDDDSEDIDDDFGIQSFTKEQAAEADSSIQRNQLLEILESVQAVQSRLVRVTGTVSGDNAAIMAQIASAAMDLSTTAMSMSQTEKEVANA